MAAKPEQETPAVFDEHRLEMIRLARKINEEAGIGGEPQWTIEELRRSMEASGIRAEDNEGSRELLRMRYGSDYDEWYGNASNRASVTSSDGSIAMPSKATADPAILNKQERARLLRMAEDADAAAGILGEPEGTVQDLRRRMEESGIRPEDNIASRELLRMRYGDESDD
jgi:hypothetical protein